jgi:hypothetical protein
VSAAAYRAYLVTRYKVSPRQTPEEGLSEIQKERERFARRYEEPEIGVKFREQSSSVTAPRSGVRCPGCRMNTWRHLSPPQNRCVAS